MIFDCPPSSSLIAVNAIIAADGALIPVAGDYLSLTGLARLMLTLKRLEPLRRRTSRKWIFLSRFIARRRLAQEVRGKLLQHFPECLLASVISEELCSPSVPAWARPYSSIGPAAAPPLSLPS